MYHNIIKCWHEFAGAGLRNHQSNYGTIMSHNNVVFVWYVASYQGDHSVVTTIPKELAIFYSINTRAYKQYIASWN